MNNYYIEANHLIKEFKNKVVVQDISFGVQPGTIFGLLGPNGAGKTTTLRMLTGQLQPNSGKALINGKDPIRNHETVRKEIGIVFEDQNIYERLNARQNLLFTCWLYHLPPKRADEALEMVGLLKDAKRTVQNFSTGMKQRLMIARAIMSNPLALFLDEPARGLDPVSARNIREIIQNLARNGAAIILTTHMMDEAEFLCHQVGFINHGKLIACSTPEQLKLHYSGKNVKVTLQHEDNTETSAMFNLEQESDRIRLAHELMENKVTILQSQQASLEDVFIHLASQNA